MARILTWNIGSFVFLKFGKYIGLPNRDDLEYFQPDLNAEFVSKSLDKFDPDFLFLQEFWKPSDADKIQSLKEYPHRKFLDMWYRKNGALLASKKPFSLEEKDGVFLVSYGRFKLIPIHFYAFSASKRFADVASVIKQSTGEVTDTLLFGDTNIWSRGKWFIFRSDKKLYLELVRFLKDVSENIIGTNCFGFGLDKVFASRDINIENIQSPKLRGDYMDHYPIVFDVRDDNI